MFEWDDGSFQRKPIEAAHVARWIDAAKGARRSWREPRNRGHAHIEALGNLAQQVAVRAAAKGLGLVIGELERSPQALPTCLGAGAAFARAGARHALIAAETVVVQRWQAFTGEGAVLEPDGRTFDDLVAERKA